MASITADRPTSTLAVLAGGAGSRMGMPKALLQIDGKPILQWTLQRIQWPGPTLLVTAPAIANPPGREHFTACATDPEDGLGPLRGILTALENLSTPSMVVIPVDMPHIERAHLDWLLDRLPERPKILGLFCRPGSSDQIEPLPCAIRAEARQFIAARLRAGHRSVQELARDPSFGVIEAPDTWPPETWMNLNDPQALRRFQFARGRTS
jgi:molybdenum cofactor guanylyltransferase